MLGTLLWAPLGGGAKDVKLIPPDCGASPDDWNELGRGEDGNKGAGGIEKDDEDVFSFFDCSPFPLWIVDVRLASKAATASGDKVWENDRGGKGTLPGAGATKDG